MKKSVWIIYAVILSFYIIGAGFKEWGYNILSASVMFGYLVITFSFSFLLDAFLEYVFNIIIDASQGVGK